MRAVGALAAGFWLLSAAGRSVAEVADDGPELRAEDGRDADEDEPLLGPCDWLEERHPRDPAVLKALPPVVGAITEHVCAHLAEPRAPSPTLSRWTAEVDEAMKPLKQYLRAALKSDPQLAKRPLAWQRLGTWFSDVSVSSEAFEIRALEAIVAEALWDAGVRERGVVADLESVYDGGGERLPAVVLASHVLHCWKLAGDLESARRFHLKVLGYEEGKGTGAQPFRYLFDALDVWRVSQDPRPGLRILTWPDPGDVLPDGLAAELQRSHAEISEDAKALATRLREQGDAYPALTGQGQWSKLELYSVENGWNEELCAGEMKRLCGMVRGRLKSESEQGLDWKQRGYLMPHDEMVGLFRVRGPGFAYMHHGQDSRVNTHFCLYGCSQSQITVAGETKPYSDGSIFAFEDRCDHEVANNASEDRVNLVIGVVHPDFDPDKRPASMGEARLRFILSHASHAADADAEGVHLQELSPRLLGTGLLLAAHYGRRHTVELLLDAGAPLDSTDHAGAHATHAAAAAGHEPVLRLLLERGVDVRATDADGREPWHVAADDEGIRRLLRDYGVDPTGHDRTDL